MTPAPAYWRLLLPLPLALPADLAAEWRAKGRTDVFHGQWEDAVAASAAFYAEPAKPAAEPQGSLFGTEAAA